MKTRHLLPLVAIGMTFAACGGDDQGSADTTASAGAEATATTAGGPGAGALAYAECMRDNGVDDFPDPEITGDGRVMMTPGTGPADPDMPAAQEACADLMQQGGEGVDIDPAREAEMQEQALAFAQCMRENGVPDFPDPQVDGGRVLMGGGGGDPNAPEFQAASELCQSESGLGSGGQP